MQPPAPISGTRKHRLGLEAVPGYTPWGPTSPKLTASRSRTVNWVQRLRTYEPRAWPVQQILTAFLVYCFIFGFLLATSVGNCLLSYETDFLPSSIILSWKYSFLWTHASWTCKMGNLRGLKPIFQHCKLMGPKSKSSLSAPAARQWLQAFSLTSNPELWKN